MSPKRVTRSFLWTMTRRPSTIRTTIISPTSPKSHAIVLNRKVFRQCLKPLLRTYLGEFALQSGRSPRKHASGNRCWTERERKEKVLWSVLQSRCQGKVDGTVLGFILFRLTKNSILMNEISEKSWNEELNKLFMVKIQLRENFYLTEYGLEIQNLERKF